MDSSPHLYRQNQISNLTLNQTNIQELELTHPFKILVFKILIMHQLSHYFFSHFEKKKRKEKRSRTDEDKSLVKHLIFDLKQGFILQES